MSTDGIIVGIFQVRLGGFAVHADQGSRKMMGRHGSSGIAQKRF
jgi:hypothetical protein